MNSWLESEEIKKKIEEEKMQLKANERKIRLQERIQNENQIDSHLNQFYEIGNRFAQLKNKSIIVSRLKAVGVLFVGFPSEQVIVGLNDYDGSAYYSKIIVRGSRGICFSDSGSKQILITIYYDMERRSENYLHIPLEKSQKTILDKECSNQDIINWSEEKIINVFRWLILDIDIIEESLPGENQNLILKEREAELLKKKNFEDEIARKAIETDKSDLDNAIGKGIIGGFVGLIIGLIGGGIISWVLWGLLKIFGHDIGHVGINFIILVISAICVYIGYKVNFQEKRNKK